MKPQWLSYGLVLAGFCGIAPAHAQPADDDAQMLMLTPSYRKRFHLRVMAWNVAFSGPEDDKKVPLIAKYINTMTPDIVMVSEIRGVIGADESGDVKDLAKQTGIPFYRFYHTTNTGGSGSKGVAVLSRYPFLRFKNHPAPRRNGGPSFGTLEAIVRIGNVHHHVFATRFDRWDPTYDALSHDDAIQFIGQVDARAPILFGGDFNAEPVCPQQQRFHALSRLKDAFLQLPDPNILPDDQEQCFPLVEPPNKRIDYVFYSNPYAVHNVVQRAPWAGIEDVSDHPFVFADLSAPAVPNLFDRGGVTYTDDPPDVIGVAADRPTTITMPSDRVMFVLRTPDNVTSRKEMMVYDNIAGTGSPWTIATQNGTHESMMTVPVSALKNGLIVLRKDKGFFGGGMKTETTIPTFTSAKAGTRYVLTWERD